MILVIRNMRGKHVIHLKVRDIEYFAIPNLEPGEQQRIFERCDELSVL